jgi:hypothetical protein
MNRLWWKLGLSILAMGLPAAVAVPADDKPAPKIDVKVVKLDSLKDIIKQQKGKVVVVDFWADT